MILSARSLQSAPFIYAADGGGPTVYIIDAATNMVTTISIPNYPFMHGSAYTAFARCIAVAPNGTTACAGVVQTASTQGFPPIYQAITIAIINASFSLNTATLIGETLITTTALNTSCVAYTTDSNTVYIGCTDVSGAGTIFPVTTLTGTPSIGTPISVPDGNQPTDLAIANTPNGETAYIITNAPDIYHMSIPGNTPVALTITGITATSLSSIAITPDGKTAYALGTDGSTAAFIYSIDTGSNTVTNILSPITITAETNPTGITTDGAYLYVTGIGNGDHLYIIPINDPTNITSIDVSSIGNPYCLTITSDASTVYLGYSPGDVNSYLVPSGSPAGTNIAFSGSFLSNSIATLPIPFAPSLLPPSSVNGCKTKNVFFLQTDYINNITWTAPTAGSPAAYAIYRDAMLTQLASIVPASGPLQYYDHDRNPNVTYTYYIVSVDASGNQSAPVSVTVTQNC
jgi:hypothetical protein